MSGFGQVVLRGGVSKGVVEWQGGLGQLPGGLVSLEARRSPQTLASDTPSQRPPGQNVV